MAGNAAPNGDRAPERSGDAVTDYVNVREITIALDRDIRAVDHKTAQIQKSGNPKFIQARYA